METIQSLISVLKQQVELYTVLHALLKEEKGYISRWQIDKTLEVVKQKETILYKEKILDEAREKIARTLQKEFSLKNASLTTLIEYFQDEAIKDELKQLRTSLIDITNKIYSENMSIKILYHTNLQMIRDFFEQVGMMGNNSYDAYGSINFKNAGMARRA